MMQHEKALQKELETISGHVFDDEVVSDRTRDEISRYTQRQEISLLQGLNRLKIIPGNTFNGDVVL